MKCNCCESNNVRKVSIVYQEQTSSGNFGGGGIGIGLNGSVGVGAFGGVISSKSLLAKRLAPPIYSKPEKPVILKFPWINFSVILTICIISLIILNIDHSNIPDCILQFAAISIIVSVIYFSILYIRSDAYLSGNKKLAEYNKKCEQYNRCQEALAEWHNKWICMNCGSIDIL